MRRAILVAVVGGIVATTAAGCSDGGEAAAPVETFHCNDTTQRRSAAYERVPVFDSNTDWLFPGALLRPESPQPGPVDSATVTGKRRFTPVNSLPRAPLTFSVGNQIRLKGPHTAKLQSPSLSEFREVLGATLRVGVTGTSAAEISWDNAQVTSREQIGTFLGIDSSMPIVSQLEASFHWSDTAMTSRTVLRFTQTYFTVDMDKPKSPAELFAQGVPEVEVDALVAGSTSYVSSVAYGRTALVAYESTRSDTEVKAALGAKLGWDLGLVGTAASAWSEDALEETSFSGYIYGGSSTAAARAFQGLDEVKSYIVSGGNYADTSPGSPIAYNLSNLRDNATTGAGKVIDYPERDCERVSGEVRVTLKALRVDSGDELDLCGLITVDAQQHNARLFDENCETQHWVTVNPGRPWESGVETTLRLDTRHGTSIDLRTQLRERKWSGPADIQDRTTRVRFEDGWRATKEIKLSRGDTQVTAVVELRPL